MKQQSRTLPRCRPSQAPPPVPNKYAPSNRSVDVHRLKDEIDKLSQQLLMVKAQLHTRISDESKEDANTTSRSEQSTLDSRLSTVLCSPFDTDCSLTPQPTLTPLPESKNTFIFFSCVILKTQNLRCGQKPAIALLLCLLHHTNFEGKKVKREIFLIQKSRTKFSKKFRISCLVKLFDNYNS
ncbi:unnamed protein product [Cylicostephanus goldi]|uniref:Uncharacterized protein n=1 Tax=Cylicostephanus goldi TaxID=71465 RepID=A0A3P7MCP9_CYLGO|nr:unnamed protein product [Cylicostephanus goldi]